MKQLTQLTPEQEALIPVVRQKWLDYLLSCKNNINKEQATTQIEWLYEFCGLSKPKIIYVDSPMACQYVAHYLKQLANIDLKDITPTPNIANIAKAMLHIIHEELRTLDDGQFCEKIFMLMGNSIDVAQQNIINPVDDATRNDIANHNISQQVYKQIRTKVINESQGNILNNIWLEKAKQISYLITEQASTIKSAVNNNVEGEIHEEIERVRSASIVNTMEAIPSNIRAEIYSQIARIVNQQISNIKSATNDNVGKEIEVKTGNQISMSTEQVKAQIETQAGNQIWKPINNQISNQVENQVLNQVGDQVRNQAGNQIWNQIWNQVGDQVRSQVGSQVLEQVGSQVLEQVENQVLEQVGNQVWSQVLDQVRSQVLEQVENQVLEQVGNQVGNQIWNQVDDRIRIQIRNLVDNHIKRPLENQVDNSVSDQIQDYIGEQTWDLMTNQIGELIFAKINDSVLAINLELANAEIAYQTTIPTREQIYDQVMEGINREICVQIYDQLCETIYNQIAEEIEEKVHNQGVTNPMEYVNFSSYGNISDFGWVAFYDYFTQIGIVQNDNFQEFKKLLESNIYDMIQLKGFCIVSSMPDKIVRDEQNRLHNESGPTIHFRDGYEQYYWHGINIPKWWITNKELITKEVYNSESNAEKRRCIVEIIGNKQLVQMLDLQVLDEDVDNAGNTMKLLASRVADPLANEKLYFYQCICPSTGREYYLRVPKCKTVLEAFKWGFNNEPIEVRHGDVGLVNLLNPKNMPIYQS